MNCSNCGGALDAAARFCPQCGAPVAAAAPPPVPPAPPVPPPGWAPPQPQPPLPQPPQQYPEHARYTPQQPPPAWGAQPAYPPPGPPAWGAPPGYPAAPSREHSTKGLRIAGAVLMFGAAAFNLAGVFPDYYENSGTIFDDRTTLVMNIGYIVVLTLTGVFLLAAARPKRWTAAAGATALVVSTAAAAVRAGDLARLWSIDLSGGAGFYLQTIGDLCAVTVAVLAILILVHSRARVGADLWSLGPAAFGILGLIAMIIGEASSRFTLTYSAAGSSQEIINAPGQFTDFGWANTTQVGMWLVVVLAIALGTFLFPRLAGGWGMLTGGALVLVLAVVPPLATAGLAQDYGSGGLYVATLGLRPAFWWTAVAVGLLVIGGLITHVAPDVIDEPEAVSTP